MDLTLSESELAFQAEARAWLEANVPAEPLPSMDTADGFVAHQAWEAKLSDAKWSVVSWPTAYSGREASLVEWVIFEEEYYRAGAPGRVSQNGIFLLAPIIFDHGTPEQQDRFLPTMATGEKIWAQCWSEPEAGSDLASLRSTATRDDERGGWVLNGQKTWSSRASFAHWGFGLFRSDPGAERHNGLTYFLFPLEREGITVRPIAQLDGEAGFAEVFFEDVFVPDADVLGAPGDGWRVAMSTAGNERGLSLRSPGRFCAAADRLVGLYKDTVVSRLGAGAPHTSTTDSVVEVREPLGPSLETTPTGEQVVAESVVEVRAPLGPSHETTASGEQVVAESVVEVREPLGPSLETTASGEQVVAESVVEVRGPLGPSLETSAIGERVVDAWMKAQAYRLYTWGTVTRLADGGEMGAAGSVNKVFWSELDIALHETALDLRGAEGEVESTWLDGYTFSLSGPIYAGTNEIQRNIVAERILGLPREPKGAAK